LIRGLVQGVYRHPLVHVAHGATIRGVAGYVGSFVTTVESEGRVFEIHHGATIIATGAEEHRPTEYLYGQDERVLTQLDLERRIHEDDNELWAADRLAMIQCVGCRQPERNYCSRVCCGEAVKNALEIKRQRPDMEIYILFRDMRTYGFAEDYYREAADRGVKFIRWQPEEKPRVEAGTGDSGKPVLVITVADPILHKRLQLDVDFLALSAAMVPSPARVEMARLFKVAESPDGFFQEAHVKLRPVEFAAEGLFLCGTAHYPKQISETIAQACGAAARAATLLSQDTVKASGSVCQVNIADCVTCGACIAACTYGAIDWADTEQGPKARVNPVLCKGDGLCNAKCPTHAIVLKHFTNEEVNSQIDAALAS
jgi:heterodisulfide reductase subunit A